MPRKEGSTNMFIKYKLYRKSDAMWVEHGLYRTLVDLGKVTGYSPPYISAALKGQPLHFREKWKVEKLDVPLEALT